MNQPVDPGPRRIPSTLGGLVFLLVVASTAAGLAVVAFGPWRRGVAAIGAALILGALMRAALRDADAGMLRVRRHRWLDVLIVVLVALGLALVAALPPARRAARLLPADAVRWE